MGAAGNLLVRGGTLVDGRGSTPVHADVRVRDGWIVEVGAGLEPEGERELDATGAYVTPGFIDAHTHVDPSIFWDPGCDPLPLHGVTTVVTGNCSLSLAPLRDETRDQVIDLFCFIEDMPVEAFERGIPWSWSDWQGYRKAIDVEGAGVHIAPLVGHSILRLDVLGGVAFDRVSTPEERDALAQRLRECLEAGAFGFSTSFQDTDRRGRPVPSRKADDEEFMALAEVLREAGRGVIEFVPHFDQPEKQIADIERIHRISQAAGVPGTWTQLAWGDLNDAQIQPLLEQAARTQAEGPGVFPQVSPRPFDVVLDLMGTAFFMFQRNWHEVLQCEPASRRLRLADEEWRAAAREEWDSVGFSIFPIDRLDKVRLTRVAKPEQERFLGATLADLVKERGGHASDVLADWVIENDLDPGLMLLGLANDDPEKVSDLLHHSSTVVGASDAGAHVHGLCGAGDTTLLLETHVRERGDLSIEAAVAAMTSDVAKLFGIRDRGIVAPGYAGDLAVFDLAEVHYEGDEFVNDLPDGSGRLRRSGSGFRATIVSGTPTQLSGTATGEHPGRCLDPQSLPRD
ncbi:MAG: amidohydrolase family protein [Myxococcota bacterium]|nr:amidohydrolase family protein [Myxococcota bacterium]